MRGPAGIAVAVLLAALSPVVAWAQAAPSGAAQVATDEHEAARGLTAQAVRLYDAGELTEALALFEKADALYPTPQYRVYIARTYARLGKVRRAVATYGEAVRMALPPGAPPSFAEAQKTAAEESAEAAKHLSILRVDVAGAPAADVTLTVDGEPIGSAGALRLELDPGRHRIAATAPRTASGLQIVELKEGASSSVVVTLTPLPAPRSAPQPRPFRTLAIASGALGVAGLVVAIASGAVLTSKHGSIVSECPNRSCTPAGRALIDGAAPIDHVNLAGWITAAAGGAAAGVFVLLDRRAQKAATSVAPAVLPGGAGVSLTRSF